MGVHTIDGDRVVIVGGSSGIGLATAAAVVENGGEVVIGSRGAADREAAVDRLGDAATGHPVDLVDRSSIGAFFDAIGPFDHLLLTAAYIPTGGFADAGYDEVRRAFAVKGLGYFAAATRAVTSIEDDGSITVVSAVSAHQPSADYFALGMANAAVEVLIRSVAVECGPIRANAISPGTVDTWGMDDARAREMRESLPAGHVGQPEDVADAALFCMANPYLDGEVLVLDGGDRLG